jgi:hypothetical protein
VLASNESSDIYTVNRQQLPIEHFRMTISILRSSSVRTIRPLTPSASLIRRPIFFSNSMKLVGAKSFSVFLLANVMSSSSSSAFRPLSFGKQASPSQKEQQKQCRWYDKECLSTFRGGSTLSSASTTVLNSAVVASEDAAAPVEIFRKDYEPLPHIVSKINMDFNIDQGKTIVTSELFLEENASYEGKSRDLTLDGDESCVKLLSLTLNGKNLEEEKDYTLEPGKLILKNPPAEAVLKTVVEIVPEDNTQLSGLYKDGPMYCTQCEAMGFRRITYYPDRPDIMAIFENVRLEASKEEYPILLANGNMIESGDMEDGRHYAVWTDPFPKPSYLFCCVAGDLGKIYDTYTTSSGRKVDLQLFSEAHNVHKLDYAMESLKRSMKWDEDKYGLEYDLDLYNIVAVDSFNMGAMENKVRIL